MQGPKGRPKFQKWIRRNGLISRRSPSPPPDPPPDQATKSFMDDVLGLLRIKIKKGVNLAVRDVSRRSSDPYVVVKLGHQKLRTSVVKKDLNPQWNEDLTLTVIDPAIPVKLKVYDRDTFSKDDKMGDAEFSIKSFVESLKIDTNGIPSGTILNRELPNRSNCLSKESCVICQDAKVVQDMCLRLQNVECGEVELQLQWIDLKGGL